MRAQKTRETLLIKEGTLFLSRPCIFSTNFYNTYLQQLGYKRIFANNQRLKKIRMPEWVIQL
jgi:hypothetical protein